MSTTDSPVSPSGNPPLRFGILGCGGMARQHAQQFVKHPDAVLVALCDVSPEAAQGLAEFVTAQGGERPVCYPDATAMYRNAALDAVVIVTPHTQHYQQGLEALEAGCHVMMEKPMVTNSDDARALASAAAGADRVLMVGFITSYKPVFQYLREQIRTRALGNLQLVNGYLSQSWLKPTTGKWRQDPALSGGGQAYDSGAHLLNSLMWSVESPVERVFALTDNLGSEVDINSVIALRFANGVMASLAISGDCPSAGSHMVFIFDDGRVEIDGWMGNFIKVWKGKEVFEPELPESVGTPINNLIDVLRGRAEAATTPTNGILHSELMDAIYESAATGLAVYREPAVTPAL